MVGTPTIVFAVVAYRDPEMVRRLAAELAGHPIVVHVDAKSDLAPFESIPGITLVRDRVAVSWGGFSQVESVLRLYRDALRHTAGSRDTWIAVISGHDFPVRPVAEFERYVASATWSEHIRAIPVLDGTRYMSDRLRPCYLYDAFPTRQETAWKQRRNAIARRAAMAVLAHRSPGAFGDREPFWGSDWTMLSRDCVEDLLPEAEHPSYRELFRRTHVPVEMYFPTLVHNSSWREHTEFGGPEFRGDRWPSEVSNFHYIHPSLGVWLNGAYAHEIVASGGYFARKIRSEDLDELVVAVGEERRRHPGPAFPRRERLPGLSPAPAAEGVAPSLPTAEDEPESGRSGLSA